MEEIKKVSFFMFTFVLVIYALLPLFSMIDNGFKSTDSYYLNLYLFLCQSPWKGVFFLCECWRI